jgi:hypothetical protein
VVKHSCQRAKMDDFERAVLIVFNETGAVDGQLKVNEQQLAHNAVVEPRCSCQPQLFRLSTQNCYIWQCRREPPHLLARSNSPQKFGGSALSGSPPRPMWRSSSGAYRRYMR